MRIYLLSSLIIFSLVFALPAQAQSRALSLDAKARVEEFGGDFLDPVNADPGQRIKFQIKIAATGNAPVENTLVRNILPAKLNFVPSSLQIDGAMNQNTNHFFGGGLNLGTISVGQPVTVTFLAEPETAEQFTTPQTFLANFSLVKAAAVNEFSDSVVVIVNRGSGTGVQAQQVGPSPQVAGLFTKATTPPTPPRTGAGEWLVVALALFATLGYWLYRRKTKFEVLALLLAVSLGLASFSLVSAQASSAAYTLTIDQSVRNLSRGESVFQGATLAGPGDRLQFHIVIDTTGSTDPQSNAVVQGFLPGGLAFALGDQAIFAPNGFNLGVLRAGIVKIMGFEAILTAAGPQTLTSRVVARTDQAGERQAMASVAVNGAGLNRHLLISNLVRNITRGETAFETATTAQEKDRLQFEVRVEALGEAGQTNVRLNYHLPARLTFRSGDMNLIINGISLGNFSPGMSRTIIFEAVVNGPGPVTTTNIARVRSNEVLERQANAIVFVTQEAAPRVSGISAQLGKTAFNRTKGANATTVFAHPGDVISYTLSYRNTGGVTIENLLIEDNLADVLELSRITNMGVAQAVDNGVIRFGSVKVIPGAEVTRTFEVTVLPAELMPATSDLVMSNIYGNEVRIAVQKVPPALPQVAGAATRPPRTGASEWLVISLALMATAGYWLYRNSKFKVQNAK